MRAIYRTVTVAVLALCLSASVSTHSSASARAQGDSNGFRLNHWSLPTTLLSLATPASGTVLLGTYSTNVAAQLGYLDTSSSTLQMDGPPMGAGESPVVVAAPSGSDAYVASGPTTGEGTVWRVDTKRNAVLASVQVGKNPSNPALSAGMPVAIAVAPTRARVYTANDDSDSVTVLGTEGGALATVSTIGEGIGRGPNGIATSVDSQKVFVTSGGDNTLSVIHTATERDPRPGVTELGLGDSPSGSLAVTEREVYIATSGGIAVVDADSESMRPSILPGKDIYHVAVSPDGSRLFAAYDGDHLAVFDTAELTLLAQTETDPFGDSGQPGAMAVDHKGRLFLATGWGGLYRWVGPQLPGRVRSVSVSKPRQGQRIVSWERSQSGGIAKRYQVTVRRGIHNDTGRVLLRETVRQRTLAIPTRTLGRSRFNIAVAAGNAAGLGPTTSMAFACQGSDYWSCASGVGGDSPAAKAQDRFLTLVRKKGVAQAAIAFYLSGRSANGGGKIDNAIDAIRQSTGSQRACVLYTVMNTLRIKDRWDGFAGYSAAVFEIMARPKFVRMAGPVDLIWSKAVGKLGTAARNDLAAARALGNQIQMSNSATNALACTTNY